MAFPNVTYFVESREEAALADKSRQEFLEKDVFSPKTLQFLQNTRGAVSLAIGEEETALRHSIQELNQAGIAVDLWPTLPDEKGYWKYQGNIEETRSLVGALLNMIAKHGLNVRHFGLDLEPNINTTKAMVQGKIWKLFQRIWRGLSGEYDRNSQRKLERLVNEVHVAGHGVDVYVMPVVGDFSLSRGLLGIHRIPANVDKVVSMQYTSAMPYIAPRRTPHGQIPGIGILSGTGKNAGRLLGVGEDKTPFLDSPALVRDLSEVHALGAREFYAFALNHPDVIRQVYSAWCAIEGNP